MSTSVDIQEKIRKYVEQALREVFLVEDVPFSIEHPKDLSHGDYACNVAMVLKGFLEYSSDVQDKGEEESLASRLKEQSPRDIAQDLVDYIKESSDSDLEESEVAGPGFINFHLSRNFYKETLDTILEKGSDFGENEHRKGQKIMVEYTDPNVFKQFHIGHLMTNAIGESLARLFEFSGAKAVRANYQGDVGMHVGKAIWGIQQRVDEMPDGDAPIEEKTKFLGDAYVAGAKAFEEDEKATAEIREINKKVYERSDEEINKLYDKGKQWSLEHFEELYKKLGTSFDYYMYESETAHPGIELVKEGLDQGVFTQSDGAVVYEGEKDGLHTRVFLNSEELPTYEAKDLALIDKKFTTEPNLDESIVVTANEQTEYMKVVLAAARHFWPDRVEKSTHITHGMMSGEGGKKMSSRKGEVVTGESLIHDVEEMAREKVEQSATVRGGAELAEPVGIAAIKYMILRQAIGRDIVYNPEAILSFEGDSGPYLQYTYARCCSLLAKGKEAGIEPDSTSQPTEVTSVERYLYRFPEVVESAAAEYAPHHIASYLITVAHEFNSLYGNQQIIDPNDSNSSYYLAVTRAVSQILENGLYLLGIKAPKEM